MIICQLIGFTTLVIKLNQKVPVMNLYFKILYNSFLHSFVQCLLP